MKPEAASVIAGFLRISLHAVSGKTSFREHHAEMRSFSSHPKSHDIARILSAENVRMAAVIHTDTRFRIMIRQRERNSNAAPVGKIRMDTVIFYCNRRSQLIALPAVLSLPGKFTRAPHLGIRVIFSESVHSFGIPGKHQLCCFFILHHHLFLFLYHV